MNNNGIFLLAAVAAVLVMSKKAKAATAATPISTPVATNVNNQFWQSLLGSTWKSLVTPDNVSSFLMRNSAGQVVTSDGKPVDSALPWISAALSGSSTPTTTDAAAGYQPVDVSADDGVDWLQKMGW